MPKKKSTTKMPMHKMPNGSMMKGKKHPTKEMKKGMKKNMKGY